MQAPKQHQPKSLQGNPMVDELALSVRHRAQLPEHWGSYLATLDWGHYLTLTFANAISLARARLEFVNGFVRRCAFHALRPIPWFYSIERDAIGDRIHLHALTAGTQLLTIGRMEENWTAGHSRIRIYDRTARAALYVVKTLGSDAAEYDISKRLPRRA